MSIRLHTNKQTLQKKRKETAIKCLPASPSAKHKDRNSDGRKKERCSTDRPNKTYKFPFHPSRVSISLLFENLSIQRPKNSNVKASTQQPIENTFQTTQPEIQRQLKGEDSGKALGDNPSFLSLLSHNIAHQPLCSKLYPEKIGCPMWDNFPAFPTNH